MSKRTENLIVKYLKACDEENSASNNDESRKEIKAADVQFEVMEKLENCTKKEVLETCRNSKYQRVRTFYKMYML